MANEPRPEIYRNVFQAYGTYVVPLGKGVNVDFGKWASSLGIEGNYTKDQMNYSRSYWFNFLPFYHMGARVSYQVNDHLGINYWITNGTQQTEDFNGFKDQFGGVVLHPRKNISWTMNYYFGQEHPDVVYFLYGPAPEPNPPTQQGVPFVPIANPPTGKLHIFDSYATWQATPTLTFALEGDYVIQRLYTYSPPQHADGGAIYAQYQFTPKFALAAPGGIPIRPGQLCSAASTRRSKRLRSPPVTDLGKAFSCVENGDTTSRTSRTSTRVLREF